MNVAMRRGGIGARAALASALLAAAVGVLAGVSAAPPARGADVARSGPNPAGAAQLALAAPDSGLRGRVLYGPTCPVQYPGAICERPYQATIVVSRAASRATVARVSTSADGRFSVRLRAGRYLVKVTSRTTFPRPWSSEVTVSAHRFTSLSIRIDSGIR